MQAIRSHRKIVRNKKAAILKEAESAGEMIKKGEDSPGQGKIHPAQKANTTGPSTSATKSLPERTARQTTGNNLTQQQDELNKKNPRTGFRTRASAGSDRERRTQRRKTSTAKNQGTKTPVSNRSAALSSDEAKNILIENMKEEAKTEAMTYVNEVMEEAKMSANKEAKKERRTDDPARRYRSGHRKLGHGVQHRERRSEKAGSSAAKDGTSGPWKPLPASRSSSPTRRKRSSCRASIRRREIARLALHQLVNGRPHPSGTHRRRRCQYRNRSKKRSSAGKRTRSTWASTAPSRTDPPDR